MSWSDMMLKSHCVFLLFTEHFLEDAVAMAQLEFAKNLKKPIRVAVRKGTEIPEGLFDGIDDIKTAEWTDGTDLMKAFRELMEKS